MDHNIILGFVITAQWSLLYTLQVCLSPLMALCTCSVVNVSLGTSKLLTVIICITISAAVTVKTLLLKKHAETLPFDERADVTVKHFARCQEQAVWY